MELVSSHDRCAVDDWPSVQVTAADNRQCCIQVGLEVSNRPIRMHPTVQPIICQSPLTMGKARMVSSRPPAGRSMSVTPQLGRGTLYGLQRFTSRVSFVVIAEQRCFRSMLPGTSNMRCVQLRGPERLYVQRGFVYNAQAAAFSAAFSTKPASHNSVYVSVYVTWPPTRSSHCATACTSEPTAMWPCVVKAVQWLLVNQH